MAEVAATRTPFTSAQLVAALTDAYRAQLGHDPATATLAILCAQIALETGNGRACEDWDLGNFKAAPGADFQSFKTWEMVAGVRTPMVCRFAVFPSLEAGAEAYLHDMYSRWTLAWSAAVAGDPQAFAFGLADQKPYPYYTADRHEYAAGVSRWTTYYLALLDHDPAPTEPEILSPGDAGALAVEGLLDEPVDDDPL